MSAWPLVKLSDVVTLSSGGTPSKANAAFWDGDIPWVSPKDMKTSCVADSEDKITREAIAGSAAKIVGANSVLVVVRSGILAHTFPVATLARDVSFNQDIKAITPKSTSLLPAYLFWMLKGQEDRILGLGVKKGATVHSLSNGFLEGLVFPLPPLGEQRRIVGLLDRAAAITRYADAAIAKARAIIPTLFLDMFGDPANNPKGWSVSKVRRLADRISDGPFGSNLKSKHYTESGVRVWRLQNVGVGELIDDDRAFVSERHYQSLVKHACLPGDVIIGTLGDPNLRAFTQPDSVALAINKADCVQLRCNPTIATAEYVTELMNQPGMLLLCRGQITGQTRARISMGRLREVDVPIPPLQLQATFAEQVRRCELVIRALNAAAVKARAMAVAISAEIFG